MSIQIQKNCHIQAGKGWFSGQMFRYILNKSVHCDRNVFVSGVKQLIMPFYESRINFIVSELIVGFLHKAVNDKGSSESSSSKTESGYGLR